MSLLTLILFVKIQEAINYGRRSSLITTIDKLKKVLGVTLFGCSLFTVVVYSCMASCIAKCLLISVILDSISNVSLLKSS